MIQKDDPEYEAIREESKFLDALLRCPKCHELMDLDCHCMGSCKKCGYREVDDL